MNRTSYCLIPHKEIVSPRVGRKVLIREAEREDFEKGESWDGREVKQ